MLQETDEGITKISWLNLVSFKGIITCFRLDKHMVFIMIFWKIATEIDC